MKNVTRNVITIEDIQIRDIREKISKIENTIWHGTLDYRFIILLMSTHNFFNKISRKFFI